jgi:hypothetical protein
VLTQAKQAPPLSAHSGALVSSVQMLADERKQAARLTLLNPPKRRSLLPRTRSGREFCVFVDAGAPLMRPWRTNSAPRA